MRDLQADLVTSVSMVSRFDVANGRYAILAGIGQTIKGPFAIQMCVTTVIREAVDVSIASFRGTANAMNASSDAANLMIDVVVAGSQFFCIEILRTKK